MYSTHVAELDLPCLPAGARRVHIVPALKTHSLLSIGQLCDSGCDVTFSSHAVHVRHNDKVLVLSGDRSPLTGLWHLALVNTTPTLTPANPVPHLSFASIASTTPADLVAFAHATMFSPALSTLKTALDRGYLPEFHGLTAKTLARYPPLSVPMIKGHLDQSRRNFRSTKANATLSSRPLANDAAATDEDDDIASSNSPPSEPQNICTHHCQPPARFIPIKQADLSLLQVPASTITSWSSMITTATAFSWNRCAIVPARAF